MYKRPVIEKTMSPEFPPPPPNKTGWPWKANAISDSSYADKVSVLPTVSIVTPSFNQAGYLEETIRSVLLQGYPKLEYWIMDGGSTDGSIDIIHKYSPWLTGWVSEKDQGQADAINKGWLRSSGKYLGWLNSDDLLTPGSILSAVQFLQQNPEVAYIYGNLEHIDKESRPIRLENYRDFDIIEIVKDAGSISQPGSLVCRSILERVGLLDISLHFLMDFDLWLRVGMVGKFGYLRIPLARYREHPNAKTSMQTYLAAKEIMIVYDKLYKRPDILPALNAIRQHAWGSAHLYASRAWYFGDNFMKAYKELFVALGTYPGLLLQSHFLQLLPKLIVLSILGGRKSIGYKYLYRLARILSTRVNVNYSL